MPDLAVFMKLFKVRVLKFKKRLHSSVDMDQDD